MMSVKCYLSLFGVVCLVLGANLTRLQAALTPEKLYQRVLPSEITLEVESQSGEKFIGSAVLALADDVAVSEVPAIGTQREDLRPRSSSTVRLAKNLPLRCQRPRTRRLRESKTFW